MRVRRGRRQADEADTHRVLARLPVKLYITTTPDRLLEDALAEAGKDPQVALCPWNDLVEQPDSAYQQNPNYVPSVTQPLVYHLFGWLEQPESLVITDDDYFDYLIWASKEQIRGQESRVPPAVSRAYSANALLFLGFDIDDRYFRVLLHSVANPEAGINRRRPNSVAVQVNPAEGSFQQPERAQEYLETYLRDFRNVKTNMYWGTAQDFIRELWARRQAWT